MQLRSAGVRWFSKIALTVAVSLALLSPQMAMAGTTAIISGTVVDTSTGAAIANVKVSATSPSQNASTTTNAQGFYTLQGLSPDTYTLSFQTTGYEPLTLSGVLAYQDQTAIENARLSKTLKVIGSVSARGAGNLVQPNQTSDVYIVSPEELDAISGGNNLHKTLYQYIQAVPGITTSGYNGQPRIHGGSVTDEQYEFDGIPIKERMTGFFTTNLSNVGIANVEVYTGGLSAGQAAAGTGIINTVVKTGTYPGFGSVSYGTAIDGSRLNDLTVEYGSATANRRFSWYMALDKTNSLNEWASGLSYPAFATETDNGPGPILTSDVIANFHYRPDNKDDFQFLYQNGVGEFDFSYLMARAPGQPLPVTALPCPGYVANSNTASGASGGLAPNGQPCPIGLYFSTANTQQNGGNIWHHYSGIGKIQWNRIINDHSFFALRFAENFNQYIFDQPVIDANIPALDNSPDFQTSPNCTANHPAPYLPGTPIYTANPDGSGAECQQQQNWFNTGYLGDRRSNMFLGSVDYTNDINANTTIRAGFGDERDNNLNNSYFTWYMNPDGSWPGVNSISTYPTTVIDGYVDAKFKMHKVLINPGLLYQRMTYHYPGGPLGVGIWNPTFAATYTMSPNDVIRGSYTDSTSFVGASYVYRQGSSLYNPGGTFSANPTVIHSYDLQFEHQLNADTSLRIGPYFNKASNIFQINRDVISIDPATGTIKYGPSHANNGGFRQSFGAELGLNHIDHRPTGISYWLSATYDNFWTNSTNSLVGSYGQSGNNSLLAFPPVRNTGNALFSANLTADYHKGPIRLIPSINYTGPSYYQVGQCAATTTWQNLSGVGTPYASCAQNSNFILAKPAHLLPELLSSASWHANITGLVNLGTKNDLVMGVQITNLFNNVQDSTPCWVTQQIHTPSLAPGCAPFYPGGQIDPTVGSQSNRYVYQNTSQTPTQIQFFITKKIP